MQGFWKRYYPFTHRVLDGSDEHRHILSFLTPEEIARTRLVNKAFASQRCTEQLVNQIKSTYGDLIRVVVGNHRSLLVYKHAVLLFDNDAYEKPTLTKMPLPKDIDNITDAIGSYSDNFLILTESNKLYAFGYNGHGQLGVGNACENIVWARVPFPQQLKIRKMACSAYTTCLLTEEGQVYMAGNILDYDDWSKRKYTFERVMVSVNEPIQDLALSEKHLFCWTQNGALYGCGCNWVGQMGFPRESSPVGCRSIDTTHLDGKRIEFMICTVWNTFILMQDKTLYAAGENVGDLFMQIAGINFKISRLISYGRYCFLCSDANELYFLDLIGRDIFFKGKVGASINHFAKSNQFSRLLFGYNDKGNVFIRTKQDNFWIIKKLPPLKKNDFKHYIQENEPLNDSDLDANELNAAKIRLLELELQQTKLALQDEQYSKVVHPAIQQQIVNIGRWEMLMYGFAAICIVGSPSLGYLLSMEANWKIGLSSGISTCICFFLLSLGCYFQYKEALACVENTLNDLLDRKAEKIKDDEELTPKSISMDLP